MYFTLYGWNTVTQSLALLGDLKLGQYTKIPPRVTFFVQSVGTIIVCNIHLFIPKNALAYAYCRVHC